MKCFLKQIFIGITIFFALLIPFEYFVIPNIPNEISGKYNFVKQHKDEIKILLMGNSYFENGVNPKLIGDSVFDFAMSGRWIHYDNELLKIFIPKMSNLHTVIYPMGYSKIYEEYSKVPYSNQHQNDFFHEKYMHVWYNRFPQNIDRWFAIKYSDRIGLKYWYVLTDSTCYKRMGYKPLYGCYVVNEQIKFQDITQVKKANKIVKEYTNYLISMAKICKEYNIRFIVVTPPCHNVFNEHITNVGINTMYDVIENVRRFAPIEYYDYLLDGTFRADTLYHDSSHLNSIGADKFALRLKEDLNL